MVEARMVKARRIQRLPAFGIAALVLCLVQILGASGAFAFAASFVWCPDGSPNFQLTDVPQGTTMLQFAMTDLDRPGFHHGGGTVGYRGQPVVPCGAFSTGFIGPSPPQGEVHTYEFTIQALGPNSALLATTTARRKFPD
jgi:phosphatidylethanolamine-binding protein (PEBP) family uncharacterized protein